MNETEQRRAARKRFQAQYRALYDEVLEILFQIDPLGVHHQDNADKLVPETVSILARLRDARSADDVEQIIQWSCDAGTGVAAWHTWIRSV
jgi:hypothetical protein